MTAVSSQAEVATVHVKERILIQEREYTDKLIDCSESAVWAGVRGFIGGAFIVPFVLKRLKFIPTTLELRAGAGILSAVVICCYSAKLKKRNCDKLLEETYQYKPIY